MKSHYQILIVGGGTGGIMTAAQFKLRNKKYDIGILDPAKHHWYQPAWTLVGAGTFNYLKTRRDMASLIPKGVEWVRDKVTKINSDSNTVETEFSGDITYDYLVLSPGIEMFYEGIGGLKEALNTEFVCSNYTDPEKTWKVLQNFKGGNAVFTLPNTPIKCGGAPQKIMYLADEYFRKHGVRKQTEIIYPTPGSSIFGVEEFKKTLDKILIRKKIHLRTFYSPYKIDSDNKKIHFKLNKEGEELQNLKLDPSINEYLGENNDVVIPYDMLHLAPPQRAPEFIRNSNLVNNDGWLDVDIHTMQHKNYTNIFCLGDAAALPTAKTGAAIRKQAPVVVENLGQMIDSGAAGVESYNGYSSCPLVTGYGKMLLAEFKYDNIRDSDPFLSKFIDTTKESWLMWILKKYGLPYLYWNKMMKGKM